MDERKSVNMKRERERKKTWILKNMWNCIKSSNIHVIKAPGEDKRERIRQTVYLKK